MESNVCPLPISNGHDKLLPACLRFTVNSYCSLFLLATLNTRHLMRSPLKEETELLSGRDRSKLKKVVKAGRPLQQIGNVLEAIIGADVVADNNLGKVGGRDIIRTWRFLKEKRAEIELDIRKGLEAILRSPSAFFPHLCLCLSVPPASSCPFYSCSVHLAEFAL